MPLQQTTSKNILTNEQFPLLPQCLSFLLPHLSTKCKVSFCNNPASGVIVCPSVNNFLQMTSTKPMDRFQNNFTGMVLKWSSFNPSRYLLLQHQKKGKLPNLKKSSCPKVLARFENYFAQMVLGATFT